MNSILSKKNYLSKGRSINDSSYNYEKSNNINNTNLNLNELNYKNHPIFQNQSQNGYLYINKEKNKIKIDLITKPRT